MSEDERARFNEMAWQYGRPDDGTRSNVRGCSAVVLAVLIFWAVVIGGGLWLADHNPVRNQNQETTP